MKMLVSQVLLTATNDLQYYGNINKVYILAQFVPDTA